MRASRIEALAFLNFILGEDRFSFPEKDINWGDAIHASVVMGRGARIMYRVVCREPMRNDFPGWARRLMYSVGDCVVMSLLEETTADSSGPLSIRALILKCLYARNFLKYDTGYVMRVPSESILSLWIKEAMRQGSVFDSLQWGTMHEKGGEPSRLLAHLFGNVSAAETFLILADEMIKRVYNEDDESNASSLANTTSLFLSGDEPVLKTMEEWRNNEL